MGSQWIVLRSPGRKKNAKKDLLDGISMDSIEITRAQKKRKKGSLRWDLNGLVK